MGVGASFQCISDAYTVGFKEVAVQNGIGIDLTSEPTILSGGSLSM